MKYENKKLEEFEKYVKGKKIAIIGLGVSNIPLIDYFHCLGSKVTVFDNREIQNIPKTIMDKITNYTMEFSFGKDNLAKLNGFDIIFRSPSCMPNIPEIIKEKDKGAIVTSEIEMLMEMCPGTVIGITGSDGKTTTTSLIYNMVKNKGYNCYLGGNIGIPLFTKLKEMQPEDIVVLELSSFQLMEMKVSPKISVITNITPNHLNIHHSYEEYIEAKKNIFKNQNKEDILVLNYDNEITRKCGDEAKGKIVYFSSKEKLNDGIILDEDIIKECKNKIREHLIKVTDIPLRGVHNYQNICAAIAATKTLVDIKTQIQTIKQFQGVEHRLEFVREINGVKWYNDSIGTSPTRTIAGIEAFQEEIVLIAGGYDKHLDYTPIAKPILKKVKKLILMGQTADKIYEAVLEEEKKQKKEIDIYQCDTLLQTVQIANKIAKKGQIVLFSPASASFDLFKDFADRGNQFKDLVKEL